jgi:hypothetical protein
VLTKAFDDSLLTLARTATARRIPVITTLCDLHFSGEKGERNKQLCELSQFVVVQTRPMAEVQKNFGRSCIIIEEAIE